MGPNLPKLYKMTILELLEIKQQIFLRGKFLDCLIGKADLKKKLSHF